VRRRLAPVTQRRTQRLRLWKAILFQGGTSSRIEPRIRPVGAPHNSSGSVQRLAHAVMTIEQRVRLETEVARMIVEALNLEVSAEEIDPLAPLFREGLGLDSIDMLEISLVLSRHYGFTLRSDDPEIARIFASLRDLSAHIAEHRTK
jgi:acyl carrier protein